METVVERRENRVWAKPYLKPLETSSRKKRRIGSVFGSEADCSGTIRSKLQPVDVQTIGGLSATFLHPGM